MSNAQMSLLGCLERSLHELTTELGKNGLEEQYL
jgi:hypothetical protein